MKTTSEHVPRTLGSSLGLCLVSLALPLLSGCGGGNGGSLTESASSPTFVEQSAEQAAIGEEFTLVPAPATPAAVGITVPTLPLTKEEQETVDEYAKEHGRTAIVKLLEDTWDNKKDEEEIAKNIKFLIFFISKGSDVKAKDDYYGITPLHVAAFANDIETVKLFISKGANVNAKDDNADNGTGNTPLHFAAEHGSVEVVKFLISKGADAKAKNNDDKTPLDVAKSWDTIEYLTGLQ
jgi:ankyrin repeat protein